MRPPLSDPEKLDAVYRMLRRQERRARWRFWSRLVIFAALAVFFWYILPFTRAGERIIGAYEEYVMPRVMQVASRLAADLQEELLRSMLQREAESAGSGATASGSDGSAGVRKRNVRTTESDPAASLESGLADPSSLSRDDAEAMLDRLPSGTLERYGLTREEVLSRFGE